VTTGGSTKAWAQVAIAAGLAALASYFCSVVFKPFPWAAGRLLFFAFGPLSIISVAGFFKATERNAGGVFHSLGTLFLIVAGVIVNLMAVVQDTQFTVLGSQIRQAQDQTTRELLERILWGVNVVQSGLDVSWDIFVSVGTIFLAISLIRHPAFGRIWSALGALISAAALILNLVTFPTAPAAAGLVDLGPGVGAWYGVSLLLLLRYFPRLNGNHGAAADEQRGRAG
jgi:hypothetical protein